MRMSGLIVHADTAIAAVANHPLDRFNRPIEQVNLLTGYREPAAASNPRPPAADLRQSRRCWLVDEALCDITQALNVEPDALAEIEADVGVRGCMSAPVALEPPSATATTPETAARAAETRWARRSGVSIHLE
jgi:hypothetical protein